MSRRPTTRTTRLPPLLAALRLHDQCTRALCLGPDAPGIRTELASIRAAWRDALAALTDAELAALLPLLASPLPADRRGRLGVAA